MTSASRLAALRNTASLEVVDIERATGEFHAIDGFDPGRRGGLEMVKAAPFSREMRDA